MTDCLTEWYDLLSVAISGKSEQWRNDNEVAWCEEGLGPAVRRQAHPL